MTIGGQMYFTIYTLEKFLEVSLERIFQHPETWYGEKNEAA